MNTSMVRLPTSGSSPDSLQYIVVVVRRFVRFSKMVTEANMVFCSYKTAPHILMTTSNISMHTKAQRVGNGN
jgi:hypothetical protein